MEKAIKTPPQAEPESYSDIAFEGAWKGRARAIWGVGAVGLLTGLVIGMLAPFIPVLAGIFVESIGAAVTMQSAASVVPASMTVFGATGMTVGFGVGGIVGSSAGAMNSVAKEIERRNIKREQQAAKAYGVSLPPPEKEAVAHENKESYINKRAMATFTALGAIAGAIMSAAFLAPATVVGGAVGAASSIAAPALEIVLPNSLLASEAASAAISAYTIGVMSMFGALFGVNYTKITSKAQDYMGKLLKGENPMNIRMMEQDKGKDNINTQKELSSGDIIHADLHDTPDHDTPKNVTKYAERFAAKAKTSSFQEMLAKPEKALESRVI